VRSLLETADEIPVTMLVGLAYVGLAFLTDPMHPTTAQLMTFGAARGLEIADGQPWRLLTHAFLHGGWLHLAVNLYALIAIGPALERSLGSPRFAALYAVGALGGGIAGSLWHDPRSPLVGGSGALFAMMGAFAALMARSGREPTEFLRHHGGRQLIGNIVVNLAIGLFIPFVSNAAHVGGLLAGFLVTFCWLAPARQPKPGTRAVHAALAALFVGCLVAAVWPVHRWDYQLLCWEQEPAGPRRDELRAAFALLLTGEDGALPDDFIMAEWARALEKLRRGG
jgi:rhomboid protease GluP